MRVSQDPNFGRRRQRQHAYSRGHINPTDDMAMAFDLTPWTLATPDSPGWFFASTERTPGLLRHHDCIGWSAPVAEDAPDPVLALAAAGPRTGGPCWWRAPTPATLAWLAAEGIAWHA